MFLSTGKHFFSFLSVHARSHNLFEGKSMFEFPKKNKSKCEV